MKASNKLTILTYHRVGEGEDFVSRGMGGLWERAGGDGNGDVEKNLARQMYLRWDEILEMSKAGIEFGSHTRTHPRLSSLSGEYLRSEIADSKRILEERLGKQVEYFAYPYGDKAAFNEETVAEVRKAGYKGACVEDWGVNEFPGPVDMYRLKRKGMNYTRTLDMWLEISGWKDRVRNWVGVKVG